MNNVFLPPVAHAVRGLLLTAVVVTVVMALPARNSADDWNQFLGPHQSGVSDETDVVETFPDGGPPVLWKVRIGTGYGAPSVVGDRLYVHHRQGREEILQCLDTGSGDELWSARNKSGFQDPYGYNNGPRCSPVITDESVFTLGAEGFLACRKVDSGDLVWSHDLLREFELPDWFFGMGCSPIVHDDLLIVMVGGQPNSGVVAFRQTDGEIVWESVGKDTWDGAPKTNPEGTYSWSGDEQIVSYASPMLADIHGQTHLLCFGRQGLVSLDPKTGALNFRHWFRPRVHESVNAARPVVIGDEIFLSAAYRAGSELLQVAKDGKSVSSTWRDMENMLAHWSTPIHVDGFIYGFSGRHENEGELRCIRVSDGAVVWKTTGFDGGVDAFRYDPNTRQITESATGKVVPYPFFGRGSLTKQGDRFLILGERGTFAIANINSEKYEELCRCSFEEISYPAWAAPVLSNGQVYLRSEKWLLCLDMRKPAAE